MEDTKEYESLRGEIIEWQRRRFIILSSTSITITSYLAVIFSVDISITPQVAISIPFILLSGACFITALFGKIITMIGTYLEIFHPNYKWNHRLSIFRKTYKFLELNFGLGIIYAVLGIASVVLIFSSKSSNLWRFNNSMIFFSTLFLLIINLIYLFFSYPKEQYRREWERIKRLEDSD